MSIEKEVKDWVEADLDKWEEEQSEWYNKMKAKIPLEYIPTTENRARESQRRGSLRRPRMLESIAGDLSRIGPEVEKGDEQ